MFDMLHWLLKRAHRNTTAQNIYGSIVALSRQPAIYTEWGVVDSVRGRLEVLMMHMSLYLERLRDEGEEGRALSQEIVDAFFADMDVSARELGTGDMSVPKKMRGLAGVFRERVEEYGIAATQSRNGKLASAIDHNLFGQQPRQPSQDARALAAYMRRMRKDLEDMSFAALKAGDGPRTEPEPAPGSPS